MENKIVSAIAYQISNVRRLHPHFNYGFTDTYICQNIKLYTSYAVYCMSTAPQKSR